MGLRKRLLGDATTTEVECALNDGATIVDIRSEAEFDQGHAPGALHIPLHDLLKRLSVIPRDKPVVTCNASDALSASAAEILSAHGYRAVDGGGWERVAGLMKDT